MAHSIHYGSLLVAAAVAALLACGEVDGIGFNLHHRSSPVVRRWAEARGQPPGTWWPEAEAEGTPEYYSALSHNDRALFARRGLAAGNDQAGELAFAGGNATFQLEGYLHYAEVAVGTPNTTFLVALDTGSDLFWVPCDCEHCGNATAQGGQRYSPSRSLTSKTVTCEHALCDRPKACATRNSSCPYAVRYASANSSSSGVLVEEVLYLSREKQHGGGGGEAVQAPVVFGCGREQQTGAFLGGVMGLGMGKVSVPSLLASSFSMCFGDDGAGRINFGDAAGPGQAQTPLILTNPHSTYKIATRGT